MDISNAREPALTDLAPLSSTDPVGTAEPASAASVSLPGDTISTSPLTFFGGVVEQIGKAMMSDASSPSTSDPNGSGSANSTGFDQAIGLLEGVIGLMSAYSDDPTSISPHIAQLASNDPHAGVE